MRTTHESTRFEIPSGGVPELQAPIRRFLFRGRGISAAETCGAVGCTNTRTLQCTHVDRHGVRCDTQWCRQHAKMEQRLAYCPAHIVGAQPVITGEHRVAGVLDWMSRAIDDEIIAMMRPAVAQLDEVVVGSPLRFVAIGILRRRTWERQWKSYNEFGVGCRISLAIEDQARDITHVRFNGTTVTAIMTPWGPAEAFEPLDVTDRLAPAVIRPLTVALNVWVHNAQVQLRGAAQHRA